MAVAQRAVAVGIDLGSSKACVAVFDLAKGHVEVIRNTHDSRITPCCVAFRGGERFVGEAGASMLGSNTVSGVKRLLGRSFNDPVVQSLIRTFPFAVVKDDRAQQLAGASAAAPLVRVEFAGEQLLLQPEEIIAMLLNKLKQLAEAHLGYPVEHMVVAVPSTFTMMQRQAVQDAALIAGGCGWVWVHVFCLYVIMYCSLSL